MRKMLLALSLCFGVALQMTTQERVRGGLGKNVYAIVEQVDTASIICQYRYIGKKHLWSRPEVVVLQVGGKISRYSGYHPYKSDSLALTLGNKEYLYAELDKYTEELKPKLSDTRILVFRNLPKEGNTTIIEQIMLQGSFRSVEETKDPEWQILEEYKEVNEYRCQRAEADYHGRHWVVWFTREIPIPEGPWLLKGLPGLVLEAYDEPKEHEFLILSIEKRATPVVYNTREYFNSKREQVMRQAAYAYGNVSNLIYESGARNPDGSRAEPRVRSIPYNPLRKMKKK